LGVAATGDPSPKELNVPTRRTPPQMWTNFSRRFLIKKETRKGAEDANPAHMFPPFLLYLFSTLMLYIFMDRNGYGCTT